MLAMVIFFLQIPDLENLHLLEGDAVPALDLLARNISEYANWWIWIQLKTATQKGSCQMLSTSQYNSLRTKVVIDKWKTLKEDFLQYKNQVSTFSEALANNYHLQVETQIACLQDWYSDIVNDVNYLQPEELEADEDLGDADLLGITMSDADVAKRSRGVKRMFAWLTFKP